MAKLAIKKASTDVTVYLFIQASNVTTGAGLTGLAYNTANLVASYVRPLAARAAITLATQTVDGAHADGGFVEVDANNMPGIYRLDLPDAVCAAGVNSVVAMLKGAANMAPVPLEIQLLTNDPNDMATATALATVDDLVDDLETRLTAARAGYLDNLSAGAVALEDTLTAIKGAGWTTETLKVIHSYLSDNAVWSETTYENLIDDGRIDQLIDAIKAKTDNLPVDPADDSDLDTAIAAVKTVVDDLETRLTAARAGYLDNLSAGAVALEATLTAIKGAGWTNETLVAMMTAINLILGDTGTDIPALLTALASFIAANVNDSVNSGTITQIRGNTWDFPLPNVVLGATKQWFAIKRKKSDPDSAALLLMNSHDGVTVLNGAPYATGANGTLTLVGTTLTIHLEAAASALIPGGNKFYYGAQGMDAAGDVGEPYGGTFVNIEDVVQATS